MYCRQHKALPHHMMQITSHIWGLKAGKMCSVAALCYFTKDIHIFEWPDQSFKLPAPLIMSPKSVRLNIRAALGAGSAISYFLSTPNRVVDFIFINGFIHMLKRRPCSTLLHPSLDVFGS
jgi:hypothetical protein